MLRRALVVCLLVSAACAVTRAPASAPAAPARRVVLVSFDSGADWVVDRLIAQGKAPALAAIARDGAQADAMVSVIPSLTAVAHASLWTGAFPRVHGATDNRMPRTPAADHSLVQSRSGYLSDVLRAEPIWETAARHGKRALVMQASNGYPFPGRFADRLTQFDVYANELLGGEVIAGSIAEGPLPVRVGSTAGTVERGEGGTVVLTLGGARATLTPATPRFSPPLDVTVGGQQGLVRVGLLEHDPTSGRVLLLRGDVVRLAATDSASRDRLLAEAGITIGEVGSSHYRARRFGRTLADGGGGGAERHLVNSTLANQQYFDGALRYAARRDWDLLVLYVPSMDVAGHALGGILDPDVPGHDPALAARVWPFYEELFQRCVDDYVAAIRRLRPDATLVIGADHGLEGHRRLWYPNVALRDAGLLAETAEGRPDLSRTKAIFLYSHGGGVFVNSTRYKDGVVRDEERAAVKAAARKALLSARDPGSGAPLVRAVVDTDLDGEALGIGGEVAPDLYFDPAPGYYSSSRTGETAIVGPPDAVGWGGHGAFPSRRRLHGIFYAAGPGVRAGARPGIVRQVDAAPTVARLLGIPPPAQSVGRALPLE